MDRHTLLRFFAEYNPTQEEQPFIIPFTSLLRQAACFERTHLPGHITGSAWITDAAHKHVLLVHHAKLNRWMQPGGHADGDENVLGVALREAEEETGLRHFNTVSDIPFDVDIHTIPARKDFPEHLHYDVRFLLEADSKEQIVVSEESHDVKWVALDALEKFTRERSVLRMKEKLLGAYQQ